MLTGVLGLVLAACGTGNLERSLSNTDSQLKGVTVDAFRPAASRAVLLPDPPPGMITVKLDFPKYQNKLPGQIEVHVPAGLSNHLWAMASLPADQAAPVGGLIPDGIAFVKPGGMALVTLVYHNPTDSAIRIRTVAPIIDPVVANGLAFGRCWCDSPGFDVPANGTWYRTIGVGVAAGTPVGAKAVVTWPVIVGS